MLMALMVYVTYNDILRIFQISERSIFWKGNEKSNGTKKRNGKRTSAKKSYRRQKENKRCF